jgi:hypothetical protein
MKRPTKTKFTKSQVKVGDLRSRKDVKGGVTVNWGDAKV